eukprot:sb/3470549/
MCGRILLVDGSILCTSCIETPPPLSPDRRNSPVLSISRQYDGCWDFSCSSVLPVRSKERVRDFERKTLKSGCLSLLTINRLSHSRRVRAVVRVWLGFGLGFTQIGHVDRTPKPNPNQTLTVSPNPSRAPKLRIVSNERHPDFNVFRGRILFVDGSILCTSCIETPPPLSPDRRNSPVLSISRQYDGCWDFSCSSVLPIITTN